MKSMDEEFAAGEKVYMTDFYLSNYPMWKPAGQATILSAKKRMVQVKDLGKDERPLYQGMYGLHNEYPLWHMLIKLDGLTYLVSQLGFAKEDTAITIK